jgi:hypothetical protein
MVFAGPGLVSPDTRHPHILKNVNIWNVHYALRPQIPKMMMEGVKINGATYGIYRAEVDHHVYKDIYMTRISQRAVGFAGRADGHGRGGIQHGSFTYDGLTLENFRTRTQLICMNQTSPNEGVAGHFRNVTLKDARSDNNVVDVTVGLAPDKLEKGVAYYFHLPPPDKTAKVVSVQYPQMLKGSDYREVEGFTGKNVKLTPVAGIEFPRLLDPVDDLPPATVITHPAPARSIKLVNGTLTVRGTTSDNHKTKRVLVNGVEATSSEYNFHQWEATLTGLRPGTLTITAHAEDEAGNVEKMAHSVRLVVD